MGLYIPNMQMPTGGRILIVFPSGRVLEVSADETQDIFREAKAFPVPPHGDLISRETAKLYHSYLVDERTDIRVPAIPLSVLNVVPTIIPEDHIGDANQMVNNDYAGLKVKYIVHKASNGELVDDCFVLRPDKDQAAIAALNAYADATENQVLAADIRKWLSSIISAEPRVIKWREWNRIGAEEGET